MWVNLLKSIITLICISSIFSYSFTNEWNNFIKVFLICSIIQIIIYNVYKNIIYLFAEKIKNDRIKEFSKQGLDVICPCSLEKKMFVPIILNGDNSFNCKECKKDCIVQINAKTFNKTDVIDLDEADAALIEIYKKIQNS